MGNLTAKESGEMVNFISPNVSKITSFKVHFTPRQEGTGDPSPENVREITGWNGVEGYGCGKNLVPWIKTNFTVQGNYYNGFAGWSKLWEIPKRISYTYSVFIDNSNCNTAGGARVWLRDIDNSKYTHVVTGTTIKAGEKGISTVTLNFSNLPNDYYACWGLDLHPNAIASMPIVYESDQEKQITSDWSKNLLDTNHEIFTYTGRQRNSDGSITLNSSNGKSWTDDSNFPPLELKKGTYTISWYGITEEDSAMINLRTSVDEYVNNIRFANGNGTFTLNEDCGVKFKISASTYPVSGYIQIENGSEPTEYQPYVGTIYGGYVDLISGELVQDIRYKQITADELSNAGNSIGYTSSVTALGGQSAVWIRNLFNSTAKGRKSGGIKANCNAFKVLMNSTGVSSSQNRTAFAVDSETITSVADFISAVETLEQNDNGLYLAYELAEPITHQLTPQQLSTLKGQNNFWSNADYVEIEYELTETFDIQKAKRKIILNQPHVESVSGDLVTFDTDMKGKLKECKVYFSPVQEGEGDPSPDNIRPISGWTGVNIYDDPKYGGNIVWNQCLDPSTITISSSSSSVLDATATKTGFNVVLNDDVSTSGSRVVYFSLNWNRTQNHRYIFLCKISNTLNYSSLYIYHSNGSTNRAYSSDTSEQFFGLESYDGSTSETKTTLKLYIYGIDMKAGESFEVSDLMAIDLDEMFGTSIIDELYENTTTSAQKIEWFKNIIKNYNYHEYNTGEVTTVSAINGDPYTSIPINWTDLTGTVYGGYVDLVSGELVVDKAMVKLTSDMSWSNYSLVDSDRRYRAYTNVTPKLSDVSRTFTPVCDKLKSVASPYPPEYGVSINSLGYVLVGMPLSIDSKEKFLAWLDDNSPTVIYPIAVPIHYQLTPQQLLTLKGINNVYSDTNGQMEIKYWKH